MNPILYWSEVCPRGLRPTRRSRMTRPARFWASILLVPAALSGCYRAPELTGSDQVYDPNVEATMLKDNGLAAKTWNAVDSYMTQNVAGAADEPGCAIGIARAGQLVYLKGYGKAELGGEDWSVGTVGAIGSVAKSFTAAAALRLHELNLLDVNLTVGDYIATPNAEIAEVRIYDLLDQSSGVGGATKDLAFSPTWDVPSAADDCQFNDDEDDADYCEQVRLLLARPAAAFVHYDASETVAALDQNDPEDGDPSQGVYSNVGYSVAGAVIDAVALGTPSGGYEAWIWDNIGQYTGNVLSSGNLLSLALTHSWRADDIPHRAVGYRPSGGGFVESEAFDPNQVGGLEGWEGPAGGWAMTIGDLTRFAVALNTEKIVGDAMLEAMRFRWTDLDDLTNDYGMGTFLGDAGEPPYWHGGIIGGHTAAWTWWDSYGGQSLAIALLCNNREAPFSLRDHAANIAGLLGSTNPVPIAVPSLPPVGSGSVDGRLYGLDDRGAWQHRPSGAFVPMTALRHTLLLDVEVTGQKIEVSLAEGTVRGSSAEPAQGRPMQSLGAADFSTNPRFATRATDVTLETERGVLPIKKLVVAGAFDRQGEGLASVSLTGVLDARSASSLGGPDHQNVCRDVVAAGARCGRCADGVAACVTVEYRGVAGSRLAWSSARP
ncbi:MAG: serine hydrolase domain-containing protein [Woeseiaceae bacterium]